MSLQRIRYVDELPEPIRAKPTKRSKWQQAAYSMSRPNHLGRWAIVDTKDAKSKAVSLACNLRYGVYKAFSSYEVETAVRINERGQWHVYARITGFKPIKGKETESEHQNGHSVVAAS